MSKIYVNMKRMREVYYKNNGECLCCSGKECPCNDFLNTGDCDCLVFVKSIDIPELK